MAVQMLKDEDKQQYGNNTSQVLNNFYESERNMGSDFKSNLKIGSLTRRFSVDMDPYKPVSDIKIQRRGSLRRYDTKKEVPSWTRRGSLVSQVSKIQVNIGPYVGKNTSQISISTRQKMKPMIRIKRGKK